MPAKKPDLKQQAADNLRLAGERGLEDSFYFVTTFQRYQVQLGILEDLQRVLEAEEVLVEKTYVKGRPNLYANPAIAQYNATADAANRTVSTLLKIVGGSADDPPRDRLVEFLQQRA